MAAPTVTARVIPAGGPLPDGYQSFLTFSMDPNIEVWEKTVQPLGQEGGDPIDTTTMHNNTFVTKRPQLLMENTDAVVVAGYRPIAFRALQNIINAEQSITIHFPDTSTIAFWGYLKTTEFAPLTRGEQPEVTLTIVCTNWDPNNCVEAGPVVAEGVGSC